MRSITPNEPYLCLKVIDFSPQIFNEYSFDQFFTRSRPRENVFKLINSLALECILMLQLKLIYKERRQIREVAIYDEAFSCGNVN